MFNKRRYSRVLPNTLKEVREIEIKMKSELLAGEYFNRREAGATLNDIWDRYIAARENILKSLYKEKYKYDTLIRGGIGARLIRGITPVDIETFRNAILSAQTQYKRPYSRKSVNDMVFLVSMLFNFARKTLGLKLDNPCESVRPLKVANQVTNILSENQRGALLKALDEFYDQTAANGIRLLIYTGMRLGEVLKLEWRDIDFARRALYIRDPKSGESESIPLNSSAIRVLENQRACEIKGELIFPSVRKGQQHLRYQWRTIREMAGISPVFRLHDLRHDFATRLANAGESLQVIGRLLRHRSAAATMRYAHLVERSLRDATEKIK